MCQHPVLFIGFYPASTSDNIPSLDQANAEVARLATSVRMRNGDLMINRLSVSRCLPLLCCWEKEREKGQRKKERGKKSSVSEDKVGNWYQHRFVLALSLVPAGLVVAGRRFLSIRSLFRGFALGAAL